MDAIDRRILRALQTDCRQSIADLADQAGLSPSACHRRIGLLEERGYIAGYVADLNGAALGYRIEFFVEVSLNAQSEDALNAFESAVGRVPEILECYLMAGQSDYTIRIAASDTADYERIHRERIARLPHVARIQSSLVLRTVKRWTGYPVAAG
ncbi:MAG: Lrp/AsnC family transcriptional regulator [Hyphomicrobiaceae bacterium]